MLFALFIVKIYKMLLLTLWGFALKIRKPKEYYM